MVSHGELQNWPLLTGGLCSERQKLPFRFSQDELRLAFIDRKPLLAGVLMHRFDCSFVIVKQAQVTEQIPEAFFSLTIQLNGYERKEHKKNFLDIHELIPHPRLLSIYTSQKLKVHLYSFNYSELQNDPMFGNLCNNGLFSSVTYNQKLRARTVWQPSR